MLIDSRWSLAARRMRSWVYKQRDSGNQERGEGLDAMVLNVNFMLSDHNKFKIMTRVGWSVEFYSYALRVCAHKWFNSFELCIVDIRKKSSGKVQHKARNQFYNRNITRCIYDDYALSLWYKFISNMNINSKTKCVVLSLEFITAPKLHWIQN